MVRTQIQFEETQYEAVRRRAYEQRLSISEVVRRLVDEGLRSSEPARPVPDARALLKLSGIGDSGLPDLGQRHDDYLAEDFAE